MKELVYEVEFLSDIVLPATSNTEGNITQLDFIPGSNFLGMVAKEYGNFKDSFEVFHSGAVKFCDAHILKDSKPTYKMPLSYFHEKLDDKTLFNHHNIDDFSSFKQLKQKRNGYITQEKELVEINYRYAQKSAYDKEKRRSKDASMYGYSAIESGTKWQFKILCSADISSQDIDQLKRTIAGEQRLGKSKSAEYGRIAIKLLEEKKLEAQRTQQSGKVVIYANSRLALFDNEGNPTYDLKYLFDGLEDENIDYDKTQIKTSTFTPYNGTRQTKDYERVCINKGSVIVLKDLKDTNIPNFVGAYQSEGFGEILVNPEFLNEDSFSLKNDNEKQEKENQSKLIEKTFEDTTLQFLVSRHNAKIKKLELANEVAEFINTNRPKYSKKMNSQWGTIRSLCSKDTTRTIYEEVKEYTSKGVAKDKWKDGKGTTLLEAIEGSKNPKEFTKLLSIQMPKVKDKKEQKNG